MKKNNNQESIRKYCNSDTDEAIHWATCESTHTPFIRISQHSKQYKEIFYDITNYKADFSKISDNIKEIYRSYIEFWMIPYGDVAEVFDHPYLFTIIVKSEHAEKIAEALYDYLLAAMNSSL
ncbi:MAG: hypothetical protein LBR25_09535 [Erysipelotrichaceae bacterium]|nr:hypothetical protein [Erysipelotrichaceae bacterium]